MKHYTPYIVIILLLVGWYFHYTHLSKKVKEAEQGIIEQRQNDSLKLSNVFSELVICQKQLQAKKNTNKALVKLVENKPKTREVITYLPFERIITDTVYSKDTTYINTPTETFGTIITMESEDISTVAVTDNPCEILSFQNSGLVNIDVNVDAYKENNGLWRRIFNTNTCNVKVDIKNHSSEIEVKHKIITTE